MKLLGKILLGLVFLVCVQALHRVAHHFGFFPENILADLIIASPSMLQVEWLKWALLAVVTLGLWAAIHFLVYRRKEVPSETNAEDEPKLRLSGLKWNPYPRNQWEARWSATARAMDKGFRPQTMRIWLGDHRELDGDNMHYIEHRVSSLQKEMNEFVRRNELSFDEMLREVRRITSR